jgi:hypothetical protein
MFPEKPLYEDSRGGVNQRWILKNKRDYRYNQYPSPHAITLKQLTSLPST